MEATLQSAIPTKRILHNREPPEHSMPETILQPADPAKHIQLLDWLKSGIHKSEKIVLNAYRCVQLVKHAVAFLLCFFFL